jgi:uncharacterized phage-associated protein
MKADLGFNFRKTVQALHYLAKNIGGRVNFMKLLKLIYFADRYHLRKYATLITQDDYKAMKLGPVGSTTKNILKRDDVFFQYSTEEDAEYHDKYLKNVGELEIEAQKISLAQANKEDEYDELSKSDKEALDFAIEYFGDFDRFDLAEITHDYPEWKKFEKVFQKRLASVRSMNLVDFLKDPNSRKSPHLKRFLGGKDPFADDRKFLDSIASYLGDPECF